MMKPYYDFDGIQIYNAHVLDALKSMKEGSVQMCVTSPPYWGLRDYGTEPQIWDGSMDCEHEWGIEKIITSGNAPSNKSTLTTNSGKGPLPGNKYQSEQKYNASQGQFCQLCGAWRGSLGLEPTPELYVKHMTDIFREVRRVLKKDGTLWLNLGDSYNGSGGDHKQEDGYKNDAGFQGKLARGVQKKSIPTLKPKDLVGIPWMVAFALRSDGWYLRSDIIWHKPNPMPESVKDRPTKAHEYLFLLSKSQKYFYDAEAVKEPLTTKPHSLGWASNVLDRNDRQIDNEVNTRCWGDENGRNKRSVWTITTQPFSDAHFAVFPEKLIEPCIKAGSQIGDIVLDPFGGSGTTARVSKRLNRKAILIELNPKYCNMRTNYLDQGNLFNL